MKRKMHTYFEMVEIRRREYNKYIHKQGFKYFYISRSNITNKSHIMDKEINKFEDDVTFVIGTIAVMRLAIDPLPILLMDEEIFYRTDYTMTVAYSVEFIDEYIGVDIIEQYKTTEVYDVYYNQIIQQERRNDVVLDVVKNQYIDTGKLDKILKQIYLLDELDRTVVNIVSILPSISKVYCNNNVFFYFTNHRSNKSDNKCIGDEFNKIKESKLKYNIECNEVYISQVKIKGDNFFIEHNNKLEEKDIRLIKQIED